MKKIFIPFLLISMIFLIILYIKSENTVKVFKVENPAEIYIDFNKNLIFDETEPFKIHDIHFADKANTEEQYPFLYELSSEEIFFLNYTAQKYAEKLLKNRYVKIKKGDLYIGNKSYSKLILNSKLVFGNSQNSQNAFIDNIKNINLDEYVILNTKSKRYHKLTCKSGQESSKYKILKLSQIKKNSAVPCNYCFNSGAIRGSQISKSDFRKNFNSVYIKIFFLDLNKIYKPSVKCASDACIALKNEIDAAKSTIDFAFYGINKQDEIINALINAKNRGVKIRMVYDFDKKDTAYYKTADYLKKYIPDFNNDEIYEKNNQPAIMHNKFFIFDNQKVWTGSANITNTDLSEFNANYAVLINSKQLAQVYTDEFNQMFSGLFHKDKKSLNTKYLTIDENTKIKPAFSPKDNVIYKEIIPLIEKARKYIYIPIFFITHKDTASALIEAHKRGVDVKVINDALNAHTKYSVHRLLRKSGIKVKTENYAGKIHTKAVVIDDKVTIIGSMNITKSGNDKNDENILIIYNTDIAEYVKSTFLYLWDKIPQKYENFDPMAESPESKGSCYDGIDNDYDGKTDKDDESCTYKSVR